MSHKRVIVVTGASRGIGRAIAVELADAASVVCINYRAGLDQALATQAAISEKGSSAHLYPFDIADPEAVKQVFKEMINSHGRLDVLVNNAGITRDNLLATMKANEWDEVIETNLKGAFLCAQAAVRPMIKQRFGRIINLTSVVGFTGNPGQANYAAAKSGIIGLTRSLARELISRNITVNAVAPGYIETDMTHGLPEKARDAMLSQIPAGRAGKPEEVAAVVKFLASDAAAYITGQVIHVNGGMFMG